MVGRAWWTVVVVVAATLAVARASDSLSLISSMIQDLRDDSKLDKDSVLEAVEHVLAQASGNATNALPQSPEVSRLLGDFEDEILRELKEQQPEELAAAWNATISNTEEELKHVNKRAEGISAQLTEANTALASLKADKVNASGEVERLRAERERLETSHVTFREQLETQNSAHFRPSAAMATAVHSQINSVFDLIPDPDTDVIAPAAAAAHSFLQLSSFQRGEGEGTGGDKDEGDEESRKEEAACAQRLVAFKDMVSHPATSPIAGLGVVHGEVPIAVRFSVLAYDILAHSLVARALARVGGRACGQEVIVDAVSVVPMPNTDGHGDDHTLLRFSLLVPLSVATNLTEKMPLREAELTQVLGQEVHESGLHVAPDFKIAANHRSFSVRSLVLVSSAHLSDKEHKSLVSDAHLCSLLGRIVDGDNTFRSFGGARTRFTLGCVMHGAHTEGSAAEAAQRAVQRALDPFHLAVSNPSVSVEAGSPLQWFSEHAGVGIVPFSTVPSHDLPACAQTCIDNARCFVFTRSLDGACHMGDRGQLVTMPGSFAFSFRTRGDVLSNFDRQKHSNTSALCAHKCFEQPTCVGFSLESGCGLLSDISQAPNDAVLFVKNHDTRVQVHVEINADVFKFATFMEHLCFVEAWNTLFTAVGVDNVNVTAMLDVNTVGEGGEQHNVCSGTDRLVPADPMAKDSLDNDLKAPGVGPEQGDPELGHARVVFSIRLPLEFTAGTTIADLAGVARAVAEALGLDPSAVSISFLSPGSVVVHMSVATSSQTAPDVSTTLTQVVSNGTLASVLPRFGLSVAWTSVADPPTISYACSDQFVPLPGRITCTPSNTSALAPILVAKPCACAHHAAMHQMSHFTFDPRSGECVAMKAKVDVEVLDSWFDRSCVRSVETSDVLFLSGELLGAYVNLYRGSIGVRPDTFQTGVTAQHRSSEDDTDCCARQCVEREWCKSFAWFPETQMCDLFAESMPALVTDPAASFFTYTGYDETKQLSKAEVVGRLLSLSQALTNQLDAMSQYVNDVISDLDDEFEAKAAQLDAAIDALQTNLTALTSSISVMQARVNGLEVQLNELNERAKELRVQLADEMRERGEQMAASEEKLNHWRDELDTVRELRRLVEQLMALDSDSDKARALRWLQNRDDLGNSGNIFQPFHDSPSSIFTSSGEPKNKIDPDNSRFTGFIPCSSPKERTVVYSLMAEADVTYVVELYLEGYTLTDATALIRRAPGLAIVADHADTHPTLQDLQVGDITGIVRPEDALPHAKLVWTCKEAGWYVVQISPTSENACGSFGLAVASTAPPFELVVDGRTMDGAIACNSSTHSTLFSFDAVEGVSYRVTAFARNVRWTLPGSLVFVRDAKGVVQAAGSDDQQPGAQALSDSTLTWTAPRNGRYRVEVSSADGTKCGSFGIRVVSLNACQRQPCPVGMVCEEHTVPGEFKCRHPFANELSAVVSDSGAIAFRFGVTATIWLDTPFTTTWKEDHSATLVNALAFLTQQANPANTVALVSVRPQAGGVAVKFGVAAKSADDAAAVGNRVVRGVVEGALERDLRERNVRTESVWLLAYEVKDEQLGHTPSVVTAQLSITGLSAIALHSATVQVPLRVALSTAVPGVDVLNVRITNTTALPLDSPLLSSSSLVSGIALQPMLVAVNITTTAATAREMAKGLRLADLVALANREFEVAGVAQRVVDVVVVETSADRTLLLKNELEQCSRGDQCAGCDEHWAADAQQWDDLAHNRSCAWDTTHNQCQASASSSSVCRVSHSDSYTGNAQPQLLCTVRLHNITAATPPLSPVLHAALWWAKVSDPNHAAVLGTAKRGETDWDVSVVMATRGRQDAVETLRLLMDAVVSGGFEKFVRAKVEVGWVEVAEVRLTNARKTGHTFTLPPLVEPSQCGAVVADTEGCDVRFNLTAPYASSPRTSLPSPLGNVSVPTACEVEETAAATFPDGKSGSVIFTDANLVDTDRSVPHILAALPSQAKPHSAISLQHSGEQWQASLQNKAWLVFPRLKGSLLGPSLPSPVRDAIASFVASGGVVVVAGTPVRSVALLNLLVGASVEEVPPSSGGLSFLAGSNVLHPAQSVRSSTLGACTTAWPDQNSFTYLAPHSLPASAIALYVAPGESNDKVGVVDFKVNAGHVVYFAFDFYDVPSPDTACVLHHTLALVAQ